MRAQPFPEEFHEGVSLRSLTARIRKEHPVDRLATLDQLDEHGRGVDAGAPGGKHWRAQSTEELLLSRHSASEVARIERRGGCQRVLPIGEGFKQARLDWRICNASATQVRKHSHVHRRRISLDGIMDEQ